MNSNESNSGGMESDFGYVPMDDGESVAEAIRRHADATNLLQSFANLPACLEGHTLAEVRNIFVMAGYRENHPAFATMTGMPNTDRDPTKIALVTSDGKAITIDLSRSGQFIICVWAENAGAPTAEEAESIRLDFPRTSDQVRTSKLSSLLRRAESVAAEAEARGTSDREQPAPLQQPKEKVQQGQGALRYVLNLLWRK